MGTNAPSILNSHFFQNVLLKRSSSLVSLENPNSFNNDQSKEEYYPVILPEDVTDQESIVDPLLPPYAPNIPPELQNDTFFYEKVYLNLSATNVTLLLFLVFFTLWVIIMNFLTIFALWKGHKKGCVADLYLANLALDDLLLGIIVLPFMSTVVLLGYFPFGELWCAFWVFFDYYLIVASSFGYTALMLNNLWMIRWPENYHRTTWETHVLILVSVWLAVNISWAPPFFHDRFVVIYPHGVCGFSIHNNHYFTFYIGMTGFYIPLLLNLIAGIWCAVILKKEDNRVFSKSNKQIHPHRHQHYHSHKTGSIRRPSYPDFGCRYGLAHHSTQKRYNNEIDLQLATLPGLRSPVRLSRFITDTLLMEQDHVRDTRESAKKHFPLVASMLVLFFCCRSLFYVYFGAGAFVAKLFPPDLSNGVYWIMHSNAAISPIVHLIFDRDLRVGIAKLLGVRRKFYSRSHHHRHHHRHSNGHIKNNEPDEEITETRAISRDMYRY